MSNKIFKSLPAGSSSFTEIRKEGCYYVDKTPYLKTVFSKESSTDKTSSLAGSPVLLFTRPRRFGKTLLMNMFEAFLKIDSHNPGDTTLHNQLFHGTKITEVITNTPSGKRMVFFMDLIGFEPTTPTMRMWCAPNCATSL